MVLLSAISSILQTGVSTHVHVNDCEKCSSAPTESMNHHGRITKEPNRASMTPKIWEGHL